MGFLIPRRQEGSGLRHSGVRAVLTFIALVACVWHDGACLEQEVRALSASVSTGLAKSARKTVAVIDFTDLSGNVTELGRFLSEELSVALAAESTTYKVIDRIHLRAILQEKKLASTGIIDDRTARQLGTIAGVDALVTGSITPFGENVRLTVKVLDVSTAEILSSATADIPRTKDIEEYLTRGISVAPTTTAVAGTPANGRAGAAPAVKTSLETSAQVGDFSIALKDCRRTGNQVRCAGVVTNRGAKRTRLALLGPDPGGPNTYFVDNLGNQTDTSELTLGLGGNQQYLEPDLPIKFSVTGKGIEPSATSATLILKCRFWDTNGGGADGIATLRDIPLQ